MVEKSEERRDINNMSSYKKTIWNYKDKVTPEKLNNIEDGIYNNTLPEIDIEDNDKILTIKNNEWLPVTHQLNNGVTILNSENLVKPTINGRNTVYAMIDGKLTGLPEECTYMYMGDIKDISESLFMMVDSEVTDITIIQYPHMICNLPKTEVCEATHSETYADNILLITNNVDTYRFTCTAEERTIDFYVIPSTAVVETSYLLIPDWIKFYSTTGERLNVRANTMTNCNFEMSFDGINWDSWDGSLLQDIHTVYVRGSGNTDLSASPKAKFEFIRSDSIAVEGNIEMLFDYQTVLAGNHPTIAEYGCQDMFRNQEDITDVSNLKLTPPTLVRGIYSGMFKSCDGIEVAPELPAMNLADSCYYEMFANCTSLAVIPLLPATTLVDSCYDSMFSGCRKIMISETPETGFDYTFIIPADGTCADGVYQPTNEMFYTGDTAYAVSTPDINTAYYAKFKTNPSYNVIRNWNFVDPINQRQVTGFPNQDYGIDCWRNNGGLDVLIIPNVGLSFTDKSHIIQYLPMDRFVVGNTYTLTIKLAQPIQHVESGESRIASVRLAEMSSPYTSTNATRMELSSTESIITSTFILRLPSEGTIYYGIIIDAGNGYVTSPFIVESIKLEEGSVSTPENDSYNKEYELTRCKMSFQIFTEGTQLSTDRFDYNPIMDYSPVLLGTYIINNVNYVTAECELDKMDDIPID